MILGLGIDIISIDRIGESIEKLGQHFMDKVFTPGEQEYCAQRANSLESLAARFSVKEAAFKALGRGWDECGGFRSVEVVSDEKRRPGIVFHSHAKEFAEELGVVNAHVSISHHSGMSAAVVILEK